MLIIKRLLLLLIELLTEALFLGSVMGVLTAHSIGVKNGLLGSLIAVPVILGLHGYYISRVAATVTWTSKAKFLYPITASLAFFAHVLFIVSTGRSDLSPQARALMIPFLISGTIIVFSCALIGNRIAKKWLTPQRDDSENVAVR
jgi:hypothetical protein